MAMGSSAESKSRSRFTDRLMNALGIKSQSPALPSMPIEMARSLPPTAPLPPTASGPAIELAPGEDWRNVLKPDSKLAKGTPDRLPPAPIESAKLATPARPPRPPEQLDDYGGGPRRPLGSESVMAAGNGNPTGIRYLPVPVITTPQGKGPPVPPIPQMPNAPQPNNYVNAFSPPPDPNAQQARRRWACPRAIRMPCARR